MRLCVNKSGSKVNIAAYAHTRCEIAENVGYRFNLRIDDALQEYTVEDVYAIPAGSVCLAGVTVGVALGSFGGVVCAVVFGLFGYLVGAAADAHERRRVKRFNESHTGGTYDAPAM